MSKGKPLGICRTCQCEIVETVNDGVFGNGECACCERLRYETQPELLEALDRVLDVTLDMDLAFGNDLDEREAEARDMAIAAISKATSSFQPRCDD